MPPTGGKGPLKPFIKRKTTNKVDYLVKKPKVVIVPIVRETPPTTKLPQTTKLPPLPLSWD